MAQRRSQIVADRDLQLMRDNQNLLEAMVRLIGGRKPPLEGPTGEPYETGACEALYNDIALGGGEKMPNSIGPRANQWNTNTTDGVAWGDLFPDDEGISPPDMTVIYRKDDTIELLNKKAVIMPWLAALTGTQEGENAWFKAKGLEMMRIGKKEAECMGMEWIYPDTRTGQKDFAEEYLQVVIGGEAPRIEKKFPGFVPLTTPANAPGARGIKKTDLANKLREVYREFLVQYNHVKQWVEKERDLLRWYEKMVEAEHTKKEKRTITSEDVVYYTKCARRFCNWTISGISTSPILKPPTGWDPKNPMVNSDYARQYHQKADPENGRFEETWDHRDDGRGDEGRLERYKQAYKDHLTFAHTHDPKKAMDQKPPTFKMRMSPEDFEEQKEVWKRFCIMYPDSTPELYYDMLQRSIDVELFKIIGSDMKALNNRADDESVEKILRVIERNAVIKVSNDVYITAFDKIKQEEGEMVEPFLSRLRTAALKMELKTKGSCNKTSHPDLRSGNHPCDDAKRWEEQREKHIREDEETYISDDNRIGEEDCPKCCKDVDDVERKQWMIKKQFLNNLRVDNHKKQVMMRLQQTFTNLKLASKFDALKFNLGHIAQIAVQIEEIYDRQDRPKVTKSVDSAGSNADSQKKGKKGKNGGGKKKQTQGDPGKKNLKDKNRTPGISKDGKCTGCGKPPHGPMDNGKPTNPIESRKAKCEAWERECGKCKKKGHNAQVCRQGQDTKQIQSGAGTATTDKTDQNQDKNQDSGAGSVAGPSPVDWNRPMWPNGPYMAPADWESDFGRGLDAAGATTSCMLPTDEEWEIRHRANKRQGMFGTGETNMPSAPPQEKIYPDLDAENMSRGEFKTKCKEATREINIGCNALSKKVNRTWEDGQGNARRGGATK